VSVRGERAEQLLTVVLERLQPFLPAGTNVTFKCGRLTTVRATKPNGGVSETSGFGGIGATIFPWLPAPIGARVTAHDAVEKILEVAFGMGECTVKTWIADGVVHVRFQTPADVGTGRPSEIEPLPVALCTE
jgi:hypothetical protein